MGPEEIPLILHGDCLREGHYCFLEQGGLRQEGRYPWAWGGHCGRRLEGPLPLAKKTHQNSEPQGPHSYQGLPTCPQDPVPPHKHPPFRRRHPAKLEVQLLL